MNSVREDVFEEPRGHGQALFDNALDAILIVDNEAHCVDANPAACAFLGYSREELLQMNVWDIVQISNQDAGKSWWQSFIQSARRTGEYTVLCKNKTPREVEYRVVANFVSGYHLSILHDITEHKQAERELRLLAQAVASTRDCFCLTDLNNNILFVNKAFYETYGYTEEELFGKNVSFLQSQNTRPEVIDQMITSTIAGGWNGELINCRKDGSEFPIELWTSVVRDDSGNPVGLVGVARDITERKRAEESLRESEERYRAVMQSANDAIISADDNGKIISWNRGAHVIFGYTEDEALGQPLTVLMQERYHAHYQQGLARVKSGGEGHVIGKTTELYGIRKNGNEFPLDLSLAMWETKHGRFYTGIVRDITERKRAEEALRASKEKYQTLVENLNDVIFTQNLQGIMTYISPVVKRISQYTIDEIVGQMFTRFVHPDDLPAVIASRERTLAGKLEPFEFRLLDRDGSVRWVRTSSWVILENNHPVGLIGVMTDITDRKRAEEALQESEQRFRQLSDAAFEALAIHDKGTILEVNDAFCRMFGYERGEVVGKFALEMTAPGYRELVKQKILSGDTRPYEAMALRKDGTAFFVEVAGKPIQYQGRLLRVTAISDITDRKRTERHHAAQYDVTRVLAESATLAEATPYLLQVICENLNWEMGELWEVDHSANVLRYVETWQVPSLDASEFIASGRQTTFAPGMGLPGRVWKTVQPVWITNGLKDPTFLRAAAAEHVGLHAAFGFPILLGDQVLGAMTFFSHEVRLPDDDLLKMMSVIGNQIGQFVERKQAESNLQQAHKRMQVLSKRLLEVQENERRNLSRELHDEIGQVLTAIKINLTTLERSSDKSVIADRLKDNVDLIERAINQTRSMSLLLRPSALDDLGLVAALRWTLKNMSQLAGIQPKFLGSDVTRRFDSNLETACFRVAQEALTNVIRHAHARIVTLELSIHDDKLHLIVRDDGVGFDVQRARAGVLHSQNLGLIGMQERAVLIGGILEIKSTPGHGTEIHAQFPVAGDKHE